MGIAILGFTPYYPQNGVTSEELPTLPLPQNGDDILHIAIQGSFYWGLLFKIVPANHPQNDIRLASADWPYYEP